VAEPAIFPGEARDAILEWYERSGRRLAFRATSDPYAILVSEAMAQQTQAARAGETWTRFIAIFPTPASLAAASPADVLRAWHGLGYNRRALNLWRAARVIVEVHGGRVPSDLDALEALPGVGPYTARAVAAIAFGRPVGAVDTNVRRVLGRMVAGDPAQLRRATLQALADSAVPADRPGAWTHALMDVGATVCSPRRPDCAACPARDWCRYAAGAAQPAEPATRPAAEPTPLAYVDAVELHQPGGPLAAKPAPVPFPSTNRWLRGRIVDRLRNATGAAWTRFDGPIGSHDPDAVVTALEGLAREGLVELDGAASSRGRRARLPVA
jgi:A/G-specific adenine glycosylase